MGIDAADVQEGVLTVIATAVPELRVLKNRCTKHIKRSPIAGSGLGAVAISVAVVADAIVLDRGEGNRRGQRAF